MTSGEIVLFEAPDGQIRLDVRLERETVWLSQAQMAELFGRERSVITRHSATSTPREPVQKLHEFKRRAVEP